MMATENAVSHWGKSARIAARLRSRIVRGEWAPGQRLPVRTQLEREFQTSPATIQKALDLLRQEDLVVAHGTRGTFVSDRPPYRHQIGIVYPCDPAQPAKWNRMYAAVDEAGRRLVHEGAFDMRFYYGALDPASEGFTSLLADVAADRLAGVFIMGMPLDRFDGYGVLDHPYLRVATTSDIVRPGVMRLELENLVAPALRELHAQGRRRVALVYSLQSPQLPEQLLAALPAAGMTGHPNWCLPAWPDAPQAARSGAYLLMRQMAGERPDAIIVADDYLAEQTTLGLQDAGIRAQDDVTVLVQCNFPHLPPAVTEVTRLGIDWHHLVHRTATALLAPERIARLPIPIDTDATWRARHLEPVSVLH